MDDRAKPALDRLVFTTSRLAEFCSEKELINQTGHDSDDWPLVILKELLDNALDAAEEVGVAPVIMIDVSDDGIAVADNGPGITYGAPAKAARCRAHGGHSNAGV